MTPLIIILFIVVIYYINYRYSYWKRNDLPTPQPVFPMADMIINYATTSLWHYQKTIYDKMKMLGYKHCGLYMLTRPVYFLIDPEYIKAILTKDFANFTDRGLYYNERDDPLMAHLLLMQGKKWRDLRTKLTPAFSSGKIKMMLQLIENCADQMIKTLDNSTLEQVDIKNLCGCFTVDVICSCAFGIDSNSFEAEEFRKYGRKALANSRIKCTKGLLGTVYPNLARFLRVAVLDSESTEFFIRSIGATIKYRDQERISRNDFLQILIEMRNQHGMGIKEMTAQAFIFFAAGFETSSNAMTFCLYELAQHTDIQDKLRKEIEEVASRNDGRLRYDSIMEMKYLNQVLEETLRKYPPGPWITRLCTKDYRVSDSDICIRKDTIAVIPIYALQRDPEYFSDPDKFDPSRFTDENKSKIRRFTYFPFGEGPRYCIGNRLALLQMKVGIITLLRKYRFDSVPEFSLKYDKSSIFLTPKGAVWVKYAKIDAVIKI